MLRLAFTQYTVVALAVGMLRPVLLVLALALTLSAVLSRRVAKRVAEPLNALDLDKPMDNDAYEELSPLLRRLEAQQRRIAAQMSELRRRRDEFELITASMNEGLALLNEKGLVVSLNPAARRVFGAEGDCAGQDFLTIDRSRDIAHAIEAALKTGHGEARIARVGREYQLDASRIGQGEGVVLLVFDVTERVYAERSRQEFTANVSHELKTPLQAIMGSAELLENGLVKAEDMPRFVNRIRTESARLMALIEDILRLSRLDEGQEWPREDVDLLKVAQEAAQTLEPMACEKGVFLCVTGQSAVVSGARRLVQEIAFNLMDNAIKYNREGGDVRVSVSEGEGGVVLAVEDSGIGIPPEHQSRVFERFYRVDKSHSRDGGGTGLGLSIVKHAARCLGAEVRLQSRPGKGTEVRVTFPPSLAAAPAKRAEVVSIVP